MSFGKRKKYSRFRYKAVEDAAETGSVALGSGDSGRGGATAVANASGLSLTDLTAGDFSFDQESNRLYISNGSGWYNIALINETPSITLSTNNILLGNSGNTADITYTISEPEGTPTVVSISNSGISDTSVANIQHFTSNNTIRVNNYSAAAFVGSLTASVSDGINIGTDSAAIDVVFDLAIGGNDVTDVNIGGTLYRVHKFTSDGTFKAMGDITNVEYLIVGGGGAGSRGGGGAGGLRSSVTGYSSGGNSSAESKMNLTPGNYSIVVGSGGVGAAATAGQGQKGGNSSFNGITAQGGGGGGKSAANEEPNAYGGFGGSNGGTGSGYLLGTYAAANYTLIGQGHRGGAAKGGLTYPSGGGGGAGGAGGDGYWSNASSSANVRSGDGGVGLVNGITGTNVYYAGGGGGCAHPTRGNPPNDVGTGGNGGGGNGQDQGGSNGTDGLGGGGGGSGSNSGGDGGSGVVIIRYPI